MKIVPWEVDPTLVVPRWPGEEFPHYDDRLHVRYLDRERWREQSRRPAIPGMVTEPEPLWSARLTEPDPSLDQQSNDWMEEWVWDRRIAFYKEAWARGEAAPISEPDFRPEVRMQIDRMRHLRDPQMIYPGPPDPGWPPGIVDAWAELSKLTPNQRALVVAVEAAWIGGRWNGILYCYEKYKFDDYPGAQRRLDLLLGIEQNTTPDRLTLKRLQSDRARAQLDVFHHEGPGNV